MAPPLPKKKQNYKWFVKSLTAVLNFKNYYKIWTIGSLGLPNNRLSILQPLKAQKKLFSILHKKQITKKFGDKILTLLKKEEILIQTGSFTIRSYVPIQTCTM